MINHQYKFVFLHLPKIGGMSIGTAINQSLGIDTPYEGFGIHHDELTEDILREYFVFTFVRNPWDRVYSQYKFRSFLKNGYSFNYVAKNIEDIFHSHYRVSNIEKYPSTLDMSNVKVRSDWYAEFIHLPSQYKYLKGVYNDGIDKLPYLNYVGRFENLQKDFYKIVSCIGLPKVKLPHKNLSQIELGSLNYKDAYSTETIEIVRSKFLDDITHFNYEF